MKILFDHQTFCTQKYGGISRCFVELYRNFPGDIQACISLKECDNSYVRELGIVPPENDSYYRWIIPGDWKLKHKMYTLFQEIQGHQHDYYWYKYYYNQSESIKQLKCGNFDIFHPTYYNDYFLPYLNGKPFVLTIHDMIPELFPQYFDTTNDIQIKGKRKLAPLASAIIAVSNKTKEDIVRILHIQEDKIHVIYHGCSLHPVNNPKPLFDFPYLLYVGERRYYKNFHCFVKHTKAVLNRHKDLRVVCTGVPFFKDEMDLLKTLGIKDRYIQLWVDTDDILFSLYHFAECFVYTSEYEGFGIPILEAYKAGCPVMLNQAGCFPEIAGDAAIYFHMSNEGSDFAEQLEMLFSMDGLQRKSLLEKQRKRICLYSWKKSASQLADVYRSII